MGLNQAALRRRIAANPINPTLARRHERDDVGVKSNFSAEAVTSPVKTDQIAPTILAALGLDLGKLTAVQKEGTQVLTGLGLDSGKSSY